MTTLTPAQKRILDAVKMAGQKTFNARARRPVEALVKANLVKASWRVQPDSLHGRHTMLVDVEPV